VRSVYREILGTARTLVRPIRVSYLGPKYSFSHLAAIDRFGDGPDLTPVATIKAVFESIHFHQTDFGIVPIENSTDGRIVDTLDMFARLPTRITGEVELPIHHHLLGKCSRGEVTEVYSKPQALSQCREWLAKNLSQAKAVEMTSTAIAAQIAAGVEGEGCWVEDKQCIAGCSVLYIDFDNRGNTYAHGHDWAQLLTSRDGPLVALLGYGAGKEAYPSPRGGKAPADIDIHGKPVGNMIAQHFAQAMASGLEYKVTSAPGWT
jgi:chorismate mutase/prephenate dehydratase